MRCDFFAADDDLHAVLEQVETSRALHYALAGLHASAAAPSEASWRALVPLHSRKQRYLVFEARFPLVVRPVPQRAGGTLYAVDELANPNGISLIPGLSATPSLLLPGLIGCTASAGPGASLVRAYKSAVGKHFTKVKSYWVGPQALKLLRSGARLTATAAASSEFDLVEGAQRAV